MDRVGVRELRQNLSVYLRRVAAGERFLVTDRHQPVAVLGPPPEGQDPWEQLLVSRVMTRPKGNLLDALPPMKLDDAYAGTKALEEQRAERDD